jgi:hypothetical protein
VGICNLLDDGVVKEKRCVGCNLHVALDEALGAERRVCGDLDVVLLGQLDKVGLDVVRVVLDLESRRLDLCVGEQVQEQRSGVVAHTDALGQALVLELLECFPCAL